MKVMKLTIQINRPIAEVFAFAIDPQNTPKWIESIVVEETNEWPVTVGSIYRNQNKMGEWSEFVVTVFEENKTFVHTKKDDTFQVRYTFTSIDPNQTELVYELVDYGELEESYIQKLLDNFKRVMEQQ
ncbi:MAG: SRPBCC family protein [Candidatus Levybacteria bacterium]|nr:SRPBCC family protein [Candidatus Levybacteria bacterium]